MPTSTTKLKKVQKNKLQEKLKNKEKTPRLIINFQQRRNREPSTFPQEKVFEEKNVQNNLPGWANEILDICNKVEKLKKSEQSSSQVTS